MLLIIFFILYLYFSVIDDDILETCTHSTKDKYCVFCCFEILLNYNLYANAYPGLYFAYKFMLTLSITQVECEL